MKNTKLIIALGALAAVLMFFSFIGLSYFVFSRLNAVSPANSVVATPEQTKSPSQHQQQASATPADLKNNDIPFLSEMFGTDAANTNESSSVGVLQIIARLLLAVILSGILAFRPRKNVRLYERNLYVAQTQILLAVVSAALMMIVGDNAARAFAIFAAVSLVRFRTNIRDPKEVTILLVCLALGLATGIGRWELGLALCLFVLVLMQLLEYKEQDRAYRSMELTVKTRDTDLTQESLKKIFDRHKLQTEIRQFTVPDQAKHIGSIVYYVNVPLNLSTDNLSEEIFDLDANNIEGIEWAQKKSATDIYQ
jgi:uncharacterized membrane protein YhiD involved in acid resistance